MTIHAKTWRRTLLVAYLIALTAGCADKSVFEDGENETKGPAAAPNTNNAFATEEKITNFKGIYNFYVRRKDKDEVVCQGEAQIVSSSAGTVTTGKATCTDPILKGAGVKEIEIEDDPNDVVVDFPWEEAKKLGLDPRITRIKSEGETTYDPYLPDLIGPLIQNPADYADIDVRTNVNVTTKDEDGKTVTADGVVHHKVLNPSMRYRPEGYFETFDRVIHYHINAEGFEDLPNKSDVGLYQNFEYYYSTRPIAILQVHIEGPVKEFESSRFRGFAGNIIFGGGIVIDLVLKEHIQINN